MRRQRIGQPHETATGPPFSQAKPNAVKQPARTEMIVNEMAKLVNALQVRELSEAFVVALRLVDVGDALRWCHFLSLRCGLSTSLH